MDKVSRQRRQLLFYLGLGIVSAGAIGFGTRKTMPSMIEPALKNTQPETTTLSSNGMPLPEFQGIQQWLNSTPLLISDLKGKVGLIQFWTFACVNCQRTLPYVVRWHQQYAAQGLKVVGIHTPEFAFERDLNNVKRALQQHQINYAIAIDNDYQTWKAYQNEYWPHLFLVDRRGLIRYDHIGEGAYDTTEQTIQKLLQEG